MADADANVDVPGDPSDPSELTALIRAWARESFENVGIARAVIGLGHEHLQKWLSAGWHGEMSYMERHAEARRDPNLVLNGVASIVMVALAYHPQEHTSDELRGRVSDYVWGIDYHKRVRDGLQQVARKLRDVRPDIRTRIAVDSAPIMERDYAQLAGLGWIGKNTLLLHKYLGSYFFLGALLLSCELEYDAPMETGHCGTCRKCLDACPTSAFIAPYQLDARKCISYLTIEHRSAIPAEQCLQLGDWLYGCDECQTVCPWNDRASRLRSSQSHPVPPVHDLRRILQMDDEAFRRMYAGSAMLRATRAGLVRNALIVAVNLGATTLRPEMELLLADPSPLVRETAQWACEQLAVHEAHPTETPHPQTVQTSADS